jgi:anaerobic ribonucleoside-triphosphate reductase activating protein
VKVQRLNIAHYEFDVTTLGPGRRVAIWVQGCNFRCPGCISPEWRPLEPAFLWTSEEAAELILNVAGDPTAGISISGGEPMLQASALTALLKLLKEERPNWNLVLFSGYSRNELLKEGRNDRLKLMDEADAFIGGKYIEALNEPFGLRGSSNQEIFFKSHSGFNHAEQMALLNGSKKIEVRITREKIFTIGIPHHHDRATKGDNKPLLHLGKNRRS